jgi:glycosyltransferase involved in cell wall biosynthesis
MRQPIVSVNICMFNSALFIGETLRTVFAQTLQDFEIVIVDDGSTDGSTELVGERFPDDRITIVRQHHQTLRIARSMALAHSRGEFIAFLDSDDLWLPEKLARQLDVARADPEAALIFCDAELIDSAGRTIGRFSDQFDYRSIDLTGSRAYLELLRRGNFLASPTPFARADALRRLGGFNQSYQYVNDYEMWLRLARSHRVRFIAKLLARYRIHDTQYTQRNPHITLAEQCALLRPIYRSASFPPDVRVAVGDNLLGQHRLGWRALWRHQRYLQALGAAAGMGGYPDRVRDAIRHWISTTVLGPAVEGSIRKYHEWRNVMSVGKARSRNLLTKIRSRWWRDRTLLETSPGPAPHAAAT